MPLHKKEARQFRRAKSETISMGGHVCILTLDIDLNQLAEKNLLKYSLKGLIWDILSELMAKTTCSLSRAQRIVRRENEKKVEFKWGGLLFQKRGPVDAK